MGKQTRDGDGKWTGRYFDRYFVVAISSSVHGSLFSLAPILLSVPALSRASYLLVLVNNVGLFQQPNSMSV